MPRSASGIVAYCAGWQGGKARQGWQSLATRQAGELGRIGWLAASVQGWQVWRARGRGW